MASVKINDIAAAGVVVDNMQLETDIGGSTANKITAVQIKTYIGAAGLYGTLQGTGSNTYNIRAYNEGALTGNARGEYGVDLQTSRAAATQVAAASYSGILAGRDNEIDGSFGYYSVVLGGEGNIISGGHSVIASGQLLKIGANSFGFRSALGGSPAGIYDASSYSETFHIIDSHFEFNISRNTAAHFKIWGGTGTPVLYANGTTELVTLKKGSGIDEFSIDGTLADNSDSAVPTEKAIKTYVDNAVGVENLWDRVTGTPNYIIPHTAGDDIGATGARITKGWLVDMELTNYPTIGGVPLSNQTLSSTDPVTFTDITSISDMEIGSTGSYYLGAPTSDGSWRVVRNGNDLSLDRRETSTWVSKALFSPTTPTFSGLTLTAFSGIVQATAGVLSASTDLANGTTATTQSASDNSTKVATTAYVDNAIGVENLWNRTGTTLEPYNANDDVDIGNGVYTGTGYAINDVSGLYKFTIGTTTLSNDRALILDATVSNATLNFQTSATINLDQSLAVTDAVTFSGLSVIGFSGIVQASAGTLSASTALADGTTATTQSPGDNSSKVATTGFVQAAVDVENLWDRVNVATPYILPNTATDELGVTGSRIQKLWATDIESTNMPTVGGTSINANGVLNLISGEVTQLANINATTISTTQWGYVGAMNQGVATTNNVQFAKGRINKAASIYDFEINGDFAFGSSVDAANAHGGAATLDRALNVSDPQAVMKFVRNGAIGPGLWLYHSATNFTDMDGWVIEVQKDLGLTIKQHYQDDVFINVNRVRFQTTGVIRLYDYTTANALLYTNGSGDILQSTTLPTGTASSNGVLALTSSEVTQVANIGATTISGTQWGYVGLMNQGVATTDDFVANSLTSTTDVEVGSANAVYLGDSTTDGSWRMIRNGNDLQFQRRESTVWVSKGSFTA